MTTYTLTLRALDHRPQPADVRLAQLLKLALRGFGFRAIEVREAGQSISTGHLPEAEPIPVDFNTPAAAPPADDDALDTPSRHYAVVHHGE